MLDLQETIIKSFNKKVSDGSVEKLVDQHLDKFIKDTVDNSLSSWGDFNTALREKISKELISNLDRFSLVEYSDVIMSMVKKRVEEAYVDVALERMKSNLDDLFSKPTEFKKVSELIKFMKEDCTDKYADPKPEKATLHVDAGDYLTFVYFDSREDVRQYSCAWKLIFDKEGRLISAEFNKSHDEKTPVYRPVNASMRSMRKIESILFHLIAYGVHLEQDWSKAEDQLEYEYEEGCE